MSTRPPIPRGAPPPYAFVSRVYRRPLRPIVIGFSFAAALWCYVWGGSALWDISDSGDFHYLVIVNIILGILFLTVAFIETFGLFAAIKARIGMARAYAYLSIVGSLLIIAAECLRLSVYFTQKSDLINSCANEAVGLTVIHHGSFWGPTTDQTLDQSDAQQYCNSSWTQSVWTTVILLVVSIFVSLLYVSLSFSFYHQLLLPAREPLAPSQAYNLNNMQRGPYNPQSGYQYPVPGPPPQGGEDYVPPYDPAKVPDYYESQGLELGDKKDGDSKAYHASEEPAGFGYSGSSTGH